MGASSSVPISDQVPELKNAVPSRAVIAATADPVSWQAGAITGVPAKEEFSARDGRIVPKIEPGSRIGAGGLEFSPSFCMRSIAHVRLTGSTSWVVVAFVNSQTAFPV